MALLAGACSSGSGGSSSDGAAGTTSTPITPVTADPHALSTIPPGAATIDVSTTDLGTVLVDGRGFVLYAYTGDTDGTPTCVDACAQVWPGLVGTTIAVATGIEVTPGRFKLVARPDGTTQLAAAGHPLYTYSGDSTPGQTKGQGVGGQWHVVAPDGQPITG